MIRKHASAFACAAIAVCAGVLADDASGIYPSLRLRLSETLGPESAPLLSAPLAIETPEDPAEDLSAAATPSRKRKKTELSLTGALSAWSGNRRLDGADIVAVPRLSSKLSLPLPAGFSVSAEGDVSREQADNADASRTRATLHEAFIGWRHDTLTARAGFQIINWGRTDVINPTDNVSARDYTRLVDTDADQKLGVPTLSLNERLGNTSIQGLWQPVFRATTIPLPALSGLHYDEHRPDKQLASGGLRIDTVGEQLSWSASYFHGPSKRPDVAPELDRAALGIVDLDHPQVSIFGADAEFIAGHWVLRSETAYNRFKDSGTSLIASRESFVQSVLGVERSFGEASAFVQADVRHTFDYVDPNAAPAPLLPFAIGNASVNEELYRTMVIIGGGFALNTSDLRWSASFDTAWLPAHGDFAIRPRVRYRYNDLVALWAGADWFDGPANGIFGRLHDNVVAFVGISGALQRRW